MSDRAPAPARYRPPWRYRVAMAIGRPMVHLVLKLFFRAEYRGRGWVPDQGGLIIIANHQSYLDPMLLGVFARRRVFRPIARASLSKFAPVGWLVRVYGGIMIQQGKSDREAMRVAIELVNAGGLLILYPEGGRSRTGRTESFQRGFMLVWRRTRATLMPVAIEGGYDIWPAGRALPRGHGRLVASGGAPIPYAHVEDLADEEAMRTLREWIENERLRLRRMLRGATGGRYPVETGGDVSSLDEGGEDCGASGTSGGSGD